VPTDIPTPRIFSAKFVKMAKERVNCEMCSKQLSKYSLNYHMQYMHSQGTIGKFKCDLCDYSPRMQSDLNRHIRTVHLSVKRWKCMLCDFSAAQQYNLSNHVKSFHLKEEDYIFSCVMSPSQAFPPLIHTSGQCMRKYETIHVLNVTMHQLNHLVCIYTSKPCMIK
jgi:hypothetical protein